LYLPVDSGTVAAGVPPKEVVTVFHPVPRSDRWDGIISAATAVLIVALLVASFLLAR
jgi:hypothetical protein